MERAIYFMEDEPSSLPDVPSWFAAKVLRRWLIRLYAHEVRASDKRCSYEKSLWVAVWQITGWCPPQMSDGSFTNFCMGRTISERRLARWAAAWRPIEVE